MFSSVVALIWVVDVSAEDELSRSKFYFDLALENLRQNSPDAQVFCFLHKSDLRDSYFDYENLVTFFQNTIGCSFSRLVFQSVMPYWTPPLQHVRKGSHQSGAITPDQVECGHEPRQQRQRHHLSNLVQSPHPELLQAKPVLQATNHPLY